MIIYNKEWIDNLAVRTICRKWMKKGLITTDELDRIKTAYHTDYHNPNIFARTGMFIFTVIVATSAAGLYNIIIEDLNFLVQLTLSTALLILSAEFFFRRQNYFRSGVTDALLYMGLCSLCFTIIMIIDGNDLKLNADPLIYLFAITPFFIIATIRYADAFLALISFFLIIVINAMLILKAGTTGKLLLPFESMVLSFLIYVLIRKLKASEKNRYWNNCITMTETLSLSLLYLSGNYFVVRTLSELLLDAKYPPGTDIPFAYFFYLFTIVTPIVYVWRGLTKKDYIQIRTGIILEAVGILTIRHYYSILPAETALIIAGVFLIALSWAVIKYLKTPRKGITFEPDEYNGEAINVLSTMVISQATAQMKAPDSSQRFGGGESGGGGAGGGF